MDIEENENKTLDGNDLFLVWNKYFQTISRVNILDCSDFSEKFMLRENSLENLMKIKRYLCLSLEDSIITMPSQHLLNEEFLVKAIMEYSYFVCHGDFVLLSLDELNLYFKSFVYVPEKLIVNNGFVSFFQGKI